MSGLDLDEAERFANSVDDNVRTELLPVVEYAKECQARITQLLEALEPFAKAKEKSDSKPWASSPTEYLDNSAWDEAVRVYKEATEQ